MIKDLAPEERPREKLLAQGCAALSDVELLALLLRTGPQGVGVLNLARSVLMQCKGLAGLLQPSLATQRALQAVPGLGPAKRAELMAVMEIARRAVAQPLREGTVVASSSQMAQLVALELAGEPREVFAVAFLDTRHRLLGFERLFQGTLNQATVHPREVVRRALEHNAACVVLAHNHPSGVAEPSRADEYITQAITSALALVDIKVLDHIVVGCGHTYSFAEQGLLQAGRSCLPASSIVKG